MRWFGPAPFSAVCRDPEIAHVPTPVGVPCSWCDEPIAADACGYFYSGPTPPAVHVECFVRQVIGSVAHQQRRCTCYGGHDEDPPGLSKRDAARLAYLAATPADGPA
jgi:hypothetical protein